MPSKFSQSSFQAITHQPVQLIPIACSLPPIPLIDRAEFGIPESSFMFLFTGFIGQGTIGDRKNPAALIRSFLQAFPSSENVCLVLKLYSPFPNAKQTHSFFDLIPPDESRIIVIDANFSQEQFYGLMNACDCYVSLHRCEGYGLGMIEAMALGKPVIAANYSGNTTFMNDHNSCLVDYTFTSTGNIPFNTNSFSSRYAEVNIDHAATVMKQIHNDPDYRTDIANQAQLDIETHFLHVLPLPRLLNHSYCHCYKISNITNASQPMLKNT